MLTTTKIGGGGGGEKERFFTAIPANCNSPFLGLKPEKLNEVQALGNGVFWGRIAVFCRYRGLSALAQAGRGRCWHSWPRWLLQVSYREQCFKLLSLLFMALLASAEIFQGTDGGEANSLAQAAQQRSLSKA